MIIRKLIAAILLITLISAINFSKSNSVDAELTRRENSKNVDCDSLQKSLQRKLDEALKDGFPGLSLAVYKPDCGMIKLACGVSNLETKQPMTAKDHFRLASISKLYLGVVIMQLAREGKLSLNDPISKYLPKKLLLKLRNSRRVTIRQLMNHTSGLADYFGDDFTRAAARQPGKLFTIEEALGFAYGKKPAFPIPGRGYFYSNTNSILLGKIIEQVTRMSYAQALRSRIFQPLQLNDTFNDYIDPVIEPLAHGYFFNRAGDKLDYTDVNQGYGLPDGVVVSNGADMANFLRTLLHTEKLLERRSIDQMLTIDKAARDAQEGLNIFVYQTFYQGKYGLMIGHDGEYGGYKSELFYFPEQDVTIVLLTNCSGFGMHSKWKSLFGEIAVEVLK